MSICQDPSRCDDVKMDCIKRFFFNVFAHISMNTDLIINLHLMVYYADYRSNAKPEGTNKCSSFILKSKAEKFKTILCNEADDSRSSQPWKNDSYASNQ